MATFDPFTEQILGLREQQALAQKLRDQGLQAPEGQTVSGVYVAPAKTQYLAQALKSYLGGQDVEAAKQGIQDLMAQRQKENADFLAGIPKATETQVEVRAPEMMNQMGPSPLSRALRVNPTTEDMLAWASKAPGLDTGAIAQLGVKGAELQANREAQIAQAQLKAQERAQELAQRQQDREREQAQRQEDRLDSMKFAASLRPPKEEKPLTEFQGKSTTFGTRTAQSHNILNQLEDKVNPLAVAASQKGGIFANWAVPDDAQRVAQAQRDFINAVLRQESGASISNSEFENAKQQYFPQPGDSDVTKEQKRLNREMVIRGFARQAGPGGRDVVEVYNAGAPQMTKSVNTPNSPAMPTGFPDQNAIAAEMARRAAAVTNQGR